MKKLLFTVLITFVSTFTFSQSFEGKLIYKVEFDIKATKFGNIDISQDQIIEKMKSSNEYFDSLTVFIKKGNYIKIINSNSEKKAVYKSETNKIYSFQQDFEYVTISDANKFNALIH